VAEEVCIEVVEEADIDEKIDVEIDMTLLRQAEELPAVVDTSVEMVDGADDEPVGSAIVEGYTVVY
jgi:hypothetical protein